MASAAPTTNPVAEPDPTTTAAPEPSVEPTQQPSPSVEPTTQPSAQPTTQAPQSSAEATTQPTTQPPQSSAPPPQSSAEPTTSVQPTTQPPPSSSQVQPTTQPTTSPTATPSSDAPSSAQQSSVAPTTAPTTISSSAADQSTVPLSTATSQLASAIDVTTTDGAGRVVTTRPELVTQTSVSTDGSGKVYTVTQVVHNPTGGLNDSGSRTGTDNSFFDNTGAVAGVFVVVGLAVTAGVLAFIFFMLKRRRRQRLDRDVAAAAAAAAAGASHHHSRGFDDDEDEKNNPAAAYGGFYAATDIHGQPQPSMGPYSDYEDPAGGYDHYAANLPPPGDRTSTATAAGMAGFGAQSAQANYAHSYPPQPHDGYEEMQDFNAMSTDHNGQQPAGGYYFDPKDANQYTYDEDAAYAYNEQQPAPAGSRHTRSGSDGSLAQNGAGGAERGLKITNV